MSDKVKVIEASSTKSSRQLAEMFGVGRTQILGILKMKDVIIKAYKENPSNNRKYVHQRSTKTEDLNLLVWQWYQRMKEQGFHITGVMVNIIRCPKP